MILQLPLKGSRENIHLHRGSEGAAPSELWMTPGGENIHLHRGSLREQLRLSQELLWMTPGGEDEGCELVL